MSQDKSLIERHKQKVRDIRIPK